MGRCQRHGWTTGVAFVFGGRNAAQGATVVSFTVIERYFTSAPSFKYDWQLTLGPRTRAAYLHYVTVGASAEANPVAQLAETLSTLTATSALDGIDPETRALIRNFPGES